MRRLARLFCLAVVEFYPVPVMYFRHNTPLADLVAGMIITVEPWILLNLYVYENVTVPNRYFKLAKNVFVRVSYRSHNTAAACTYLSGSTQTVVIEGSWCEVAFGRFCCRSPYHSLRKTTENSHKSKVSTNNFKLQSTAIHHGGASLIRSECIERF